MQGNMNGKHKEEFLKSERERKKELWLGIIMIIYGVKNSDLLSYVVLFP